MSDTLTAFGNNAGKLWKTLASTGSLKEKQLISSSNITQKDLHIAIGWLAKENKIGFDNSIYYLGDTNLIEKIGSDAGKVWLVIDIWDELSTKSISDLTHLNNNEIHAAIGWLSREGKIDGRRPKDKKEMYFFPCGR